MQLKCHQFLRLAYLPHFFLSLFTFFFLPSFFPSHYYYLLLLIFFLRRKCLEAFTIRECTKEFTAENTDRGDDDTIIGDDARRGRHGGGRRVRRYATDEKGNDETGEKMRSIYTREICRIGKTCRHNNNNINSPGMSLRLLSDFKSLFTAYIYM